MDTFGDQIIKDPQPSPKSFGWTFTFLLTLLTIAAFFRDHQLWMFWLSLATALFLVTLRKAHWLQTPAWLWHKLGLFLHRIVSPVILFLMFYLIFTPFGFLYRVFGVKLLDLKIDRNADSYWKKHETESISYESLKNQF